MTKIGKIFLVVFILSVSAVVSTNAQTAKPQTVFNLEDKVQKEFRLPDAVVAILKSDEIVDTCFKEKGARVKEADLFAASEIDLNGDNKMDLIIQAKNACLFGANQGPFWIFQKKADGYQKIFSASGLQLEVLPKKSNSFNEIKISKVVAMKASRDIYTFRAGKYQTGRRGK